MVICLVVTGTMDFFTTFHSVGNVIIPTDELIFFRGVGIPPTCHRIAVVISIIEGSLEAKLPTIWTDEKQSREESERRDSSEEKRSEERRCRCAKR